MKSQERDKCLIFIIAQRGNYCQVSLISNVSRCTHRANLLSNEEPPFLLSISIPDLLLGEFSIPCSCQDVFSASLPHLFPLSCFRSWIFSSIQIKPHAGWENMSLGKKTRDTSWSFRAGAVVESSFTKTIRTLRWIHQIFGLHQLLQIFSSMVNNSLLWAKILWDTTYRNCILGTQLILWAKSLSSA